MLRDRATGKVMRTGRSKDLSRRRRETARDKATKDLDFDVDKRTDVYWQQRGREQIIHERYNPPMDKINAISPGNPRRQDYLDAALGLD